MMNIFDRYAVEARLLPPLLLVLPPALTIVLLYGPARELGGLGVVGVAAIAALVPLASAIRFRGRALQDRLFSEWGCSPTTERLRFAGASDPSAVAALHRSVERATGRSLPSEREETADPEGADAAYAEAVTLLQDLTRGGEQFRILLSENASYGFRRNSLAVRRWGQFIAFADLVAVAVVFVPPTMSTVTPEIIAAGIINLVALFFWSSVVSPKWVRAAADLYADSLFRSCTLVAHRAGGRE